MRGALALVLVMIGGAAMALEPPGSAREAGLGERLRAAYAEKGPDYAPRTRHLGEDGRALYVNRLIEEASPYLLQHAHNPVDWRPWGEAALAEAETLRRPIFLSVGYATCHWCHVMEEESFDDEEVAAYLNSRFVPIKLDREQRPDLDHVYITATQLQQGHAGWPNSLWLLPDGRPFHTGTYFPKTQFLQVLRAVAEAWASQEGRRQIEAVADTLSEAVNRQNETAAAARLDEEVFAGAHASLAAIHNRAEGGFSGSQQFPQEGFLLFLLDHWRRGGGGLDIALRTLDAIAAGGIHDHAGGGFHRYTVDPNWRTPHFEKMLYNQALLSRAFVEAWEITGRPEYARAARRAFAYVLRDMTAADGAFHAAEDADSRDARGELEEGAFYAFTPGEAREALGEEADLEALGLGEAPTIEAGAVLHLPRGRAPDFAAIDPMLEKLRAAREKRARPLRDEKIIAGWNGLMIRALAEGGAALGEDDLVQAAIRAARAVEARLMGDGGLRRIHAGGRALEAGGLDDHAWLGLAFLAIHDATGEAVWLEKAEAMGARIVERFADGRGRLKMAEADGPLGPVYDASDGATPSGESSALELFARLHRRSDDVEWRSRAEALLAALSGQMARISTIRTEALIAARILEEGESGMRRALAHGAVYAQLRRGDGLTLALRTAPGWHVNAPDPGAPDLVGLDVEGAEADLPQGESADLGFAGRPVRVLGGDFESPLREVGDGFVLRLQACSDRICRAPEEAPFRLAEGGG